MIELKSYAMQSHQGPHLNLNEDVVDADLANNLFILLDGFGGSNVGDRAANIIKDSIKRSYTRIAIDPESTLPFYFSQKYLIEGNALINAFHAAHLSVSSDNENKGLDNRGGASVLAAALAENIITLVSSGNCTAYLYRKGKLTQEILPDSLQQLSRDSYHSYMHNVPMSGIGLFEDLHYTVRELKLSDGDLVVIMTDGAYSRVALEEIRHVLEKNHNKELEAIKELFKISNDRGNIDNQSAIVLQF